MRRKQYKFWRAWLHFSKFYQKKITQTITILVLAFAMGIHPYQTFAACSSFGISSGSCSEGVGTSGQWNGNKTCLCNYSGSYIAFTLPAGTYTLETWGARGGWGATSRTTNYGAYVRGTITYSSAQTVYLYIGGAGGSTGIDSIDGGNYDYSLAGGGWNGGGYGTGRAGPGGGGGTDIRIGGAALGNRIMVAGGGGGDSIANTIAAGRGNISTSIYALGQGENGCTSRHSSSWANDEGGGGGGYYGGTVVHGDDPRASYGGTSYTSLSTNVSYIEGSQSQPTPNLTGSGTQIGNGNNGYVRISTYNAIPTITITQPSGNPWRSNVSGYNTITISGNVTDSDRNSQAVQYSIDDGTWTTCQNLSAGTGTRSYSCSVTVGGLAEGNHTVKTRTYDGTAYSATTGTLSFRVDKTLPVCGTIWNPATPTAWKKTAATQLFTLTGSTDAHSGIATASYTCTAAATNNATCNTTITDMVGNARTCTSPTNRIDALPPLISATGASNNWSNQEVTAIVSYSDQAAAGTSGSSGVARAAYAWDNNTLGADCSGGTQLSSTGQALPAPNTPGSHILYLCVRDNAGHVTTNSGAYNWETTLPVCGNWTPNPANWKQNGNQEFILSDSTDAGGSGIKTAGGSCTTAATHGATCQIVIDDYAGNTQTCTSPGNRLDTTPPNVTLNNTDPDTWYNTPQAISITTQDTESGLKTIRYSWQPSEGISDTTCTSGTEITGFTAGRVTAFTSFPLPDPGNGDHTLYACVVDMVGNIQFTTGKYMLDTSSDFTCGHWTPPESPWKNTWLEQAFNLADSTTTNLSGINISGGNCTTDPLHQATCQVTISDNVGNTYECSSPANRIDVLPPLIFATGAGDHWLNRRASGIASYGDQVATNSGTSNIALATYSWDVDSLENDCSGGTPFDSSGQTFQAPATEGEHTLYLCAIDYAGNVSTNSGQYNWETIPPTIHFNNYLTNWHQEQLTAQASVTDSGGSQLAEVRIALTPLNEEAPFDELCTSGGEATASEIALPIPSGGAILHVCARDHASNVYTASSQYNWRPAPPSNDETPSENSPTPTPEPIAETTPVITPSPSPTSPISTRPPTSSSPLQSTSSSLPDSTSIIESTSSATSKQDPVAGNLTDTIFLILAGVFFISAGMGSYLLLRMND